MSRIELIEMIDRMLCQGGYSEEFRKEFRKWGSDDGTSELQIDDNAINDLSKVEIGTFRDLIILNSLMTIEKLGSDFDIMYLLSKCAIILEDIKYKPVPLPVKRFADLLILEEYLKIDGLLNDDRHFRYNNSKKNKQCLAGYYHVLIDNDFFEIDQYDRKKSVDQAVAFLNERYKVEDMQQFYKGDAKKLVKLAEDRYPKLMLIVYDREPEHYEPEN